ncbi:MAG: 16S rRNA (uracil(1498)-N(3))-methyltransferase [Bacteroidales bacterium]|nr:16S rRNA (uracil(1498)-N(3))-methyltransferase [Bacteroidales bacterium]
MEIFYTEQVADGICMLDREESGHIVKVLRHRAGDELSLFDGRGNLYRCRLTDASPVAAKARVLEQIPDWGAVPYRLTMAVCPTKRNERYEWFAEKATEMGVDAIVPVIGDHSERRIFKTERLKKILLSASKQSLKGRIPAVEEPCTVREFIRRCDPSALRLIAYCFDMDGARRKAVGDVLDAQPGRPVSILIGPEGDFSREEALLALDSGFIPVHLGSSRLRTETAALAAVAALYVKYLCTSV